MAGAEVQGEDLCCSFIAGVRDHSVVMLDPAGRVLTWNVGAERLNGYRSEEILGRSFEVFYTAADVDRGKPSRHLADVAALGHLKFERWCVRADGSRFWADVTLSAIYDAQHRVQGFGNITRDVTDSRRFQKELMRRALHDPLTGLPNRALLLDRFGKALARLERSRDTVAVFFIDLDRFKAINDTFGHFAGDRVLVAVAGRLQSVLRSQDTVSRLSGDEFVVLCEGVQAGMTALVIAERLSAALLPPVRVGDERILVSASMGIAVTDRAEDEPEALLRDADTAMYHAKRDVDTSQVRFRVYDPDMGRSPSAAAGSVDRSLSDRTSGS